jgi:hypothetical protein
MAERAGGVSGEAQPGLLRRFPFAALRFNDAAKFNSFN